MSLKKRAIRFTNAVKSGGIKESYVYHMCEALSYAGLDIQTEHNMKKRVKEYLQNINSELADEISDSDSEIIEKIINLLKDNKIAEAIKLLLKSQKNSGPILFMLGYLYDEQKEYSKAEVFYLKAIDSGDNNALFNLGNLYSDQKEYSKAEEFYLKSIDSGGDKALINLGNLYKVQKEYSKAEEFF